jgi:hypothetical protein
MVFSFPSNTPAKEREDDEENWKGQHMKMNIKVKKGLIIIIVF